MSDEFVMSDERLAEPAVPDPASRTGWRAGDVVWAIRAVKAAQVAHQDGRVYRLGVMNRKAADRAVWLLRFIARLMGCPLVRRAERASRQVCLDLDARPFIQVAWQTRRVTGQATRLIVVDDAVRFDPPACS